MSENEEKDFTIILKEIFNFSSENPSEIYPIIKNSGKITDLKPYMENPNIPNSKKLSLLKDLKNFFLFNNSLMPFFIRKYNSNTTNFYSPIINLFLSEDTNEENLKFLEDFLILLNSNISIPKLSLEYIYQKLSKYYNNKAKIKLTESLLIRFLHLLQIFYKDTSTAENNLEEMPSIQEEKQLQNYMYFNGSGSGIFLNLNYNSPNCKVSSIENGCSFFFWINLNDKLLEIYRKIYPNVEINIIKINIGGKAIKLILKETKYLQLVIGESASNNMDLSSAFQFNKWNKICLVIGKSEKNSIKLYINSACIHSNISIPKNFPVKEKIDVIKCFENLIGKVSSLLFFSFPLEDKLITYFSIKLKYGFYKNKILYRFLHANNNEYLNNAINYKYKEKFKNENMINKQFKITTEEKSDKNIISFFCPFTYNKSKNIVDDVFGNFMGILSKDDGVNFFINFTKNIKQAGGMNVLLPIAEIMFSSNLTNQNISYTLIDKNILSERTLLEFLIIIKNLLINHKKNLYDANKSKFFSSLGLFLEKFPGKIFTEKILDVLIDIGKEIFQSEFDYNSSKNDNYINMILLNEKIFSNFSEENQRKLWDNVYQFFTSDYSQMKDSLNISKICLLLRFYDEKRYNEYCCKEHSQIFTKPKNNLNLNTIEDKIKIMNPEMGQKVDKLFDTIQIYINKLDTDKETINLYKLLSLDISPCLQKKIVQVYIEHFKSENIPENKKITTLKNLLENDYIEITEYVLSISLLDVRIQVLSLFKIIISDYHTYFEDYFSFKIKDKLINNINTNLNNNTNNNKRIESIFSFIGEHLLPDKLLVEIDCIKPKDDKDQDLVQNYNIDNYSDGFYDIKKRSNTEKNLGLKLKNFKVLSEESMILTSSKNLIKYFNKNIYDYQISTLYKFFIEWLANRIVKEKKIDSYVIDFLIMLVSKISPDYIDNFSNYLFSCFSRNDILNKQTLYENQNIYPWLIETIFYYHNSENIKHFQDKNIIYKIHEHTLDLFTEIFSSKRPPNEFKSNIKYILDYSYYMKFKNKDKEKQKNEISRITRVLFEKILGCSPGNINIKTEECFEFLIFYKNSEKLFNIDFDLINNIRSNSCFLSSNLSESNKKEIIDNNIINNNDNNINIINEENNSNNKNTSDENVLLMSKTEINDSIFQKKDFLPKYILEGLNYFDEVETSNNKNSQIKTLSEIWKDFSIYDSIIDYYYSNLWGIENICKKVNIEYNGVWAEVCNSLLEKYGNTNSKKNKNILMEEIIKLLNLSTEQEEENLEELQTITTKDKEKDTKQKNVHNNINFKKDLTKNKDDLINILNINLILLCISIEITKDAEQKEFLEKQYQQFLIFCILASININTSVKNHDLIQEILYNILGFGCLFLKRKDEAKYIEIITNLIEPILKEINDDFKKGGFRTMFGIQRKLFYRNSAVFRLFATVSVDEKETDIKKEKEKEEDNLKLESGKKRSTRLATCDKITSVKRINNKYNLNSDDDITSAKKGEHKDKVLLEFHGDENQFINNLFDKTLEKYKKYRENSDNYSKIKNYYEINKNENDVDINVANEKNKVKEKIKELIPNVETQIKQYSNTSFLQERKRRNNYKKMKKRLFSWTGFWSDKYLFFKHPEYLKVKIKNHFTKEMIKPLFSAVLDINYYLPSFSKFDKSKLFNNENYKYNINLDIDEILGDENPNYNIISETYKNNNEDINDNINKYYTNKSKNIHGIRNNFGFNYLESLYKLNYEGVWELYNLHNEQRISIDKREKNKNDIFTSQLSSDLKNKNSLKLSTLDSKITSNTSLILNCCIVKPTHHIKGNIITKKKYFQFLCEDNSNKTLEMIQEEIENDPNYDKDMGCCFGSIFKNIKKDKDNNAFYLEYSNIKYMFIRIYFYRESGLEIYTRTNKSYFLNFKTKEDMNLFLNEILSYCNFREIKSENKRVLGYEQYITVPSKKKSYYITNKMDDWQNYNISTLEYLMWLNIYSGRSFNDLTQYPIIPWLISNYEDAEIHYKNNHRDLSLPMGMLEFDKYEKSITRKETYLETYDSLKNEFKESNPDFNFEAYLQKGDEYYDSYRAKKIKIKKKEEKKNNDNNLNDMGDDFCSIQINQIPYYFGSHYSNPTYVSHFLTRIFPFSFVAIEIQGDKFDDPDRMFICMEKTFESACTLKDDVRELIPEFYSLPGMFQNKNNLNLAQGKIDSEGKKVNINDVNLPPWSDNEPTVFITEMRKFLENHDDKINKWIDLIFGSCQKGEKAEEAHNIFMAQTYEKMIKIEEFSDPDYRSTLLRLIEIGVTPYKILFSDSKPRLDKNNFFHKSQLYSYSKGSFLYECKNLENIVLKSKNYKKLIPANKNEKKEKVDKRDMKIYPKIVNIKYIDNETLRIFINTNHWYDINYSINDKDALSFESEIHIFKNNSSKYSSTYQISSLTNNPFIVYGQSKFIIKGGFWDGRLELNSIPVDAKEQPISKSIFSQYGKPIVVMELSEDEKYLFCGTISGVICIFNVEGEKIDNENNIFLHSDEITSISINNNLNMFASVSKDGYLLLYIMPSFILVRAIKLSTKVSIKKESNFVDNINEIKINDKNEIKKEIKKDEEKKENIIEEKNKENKDLKEAENDNNLNKIQEDDEKNDKKEEIIEKNKEEIKEEKNEESKKEENEEKKEIQEKEEEKKEIKEEEKKEVKEEEKEKKEVKEVKEDKEEVKEVEEGKGVEKVKEETIVNEEEKIKEEEKVKEEEKEIKEEKEEKKDVIQEIVEEKINEIEEAKIENENKKEEIINKIVESPKQINKKDNINSKNIQKNITKEENDEEEDEIYADNVFLSSSPLPCVTVYISKKKLFRTYTINGEFVGEAKEQDDQGSQYIKSPIIFQNIYFQDFLIYGTDKGCVKIRAFPKMNIIGKEINVTPGNSIEALEISKDKRYCYVWGKGNEINIIKDISVSPIQVSENISRMGFNIGH